MIFCDLPTSNGEEIAKNLGENVQYIPADVRSENDIQNLVSKISKQYGKLNVLVNCAGIAEAHPINSLNTERLQNVLMVITL